MREGGGTCIAVTVNLTGRSILMSSECPLQKATAMLRVSDGGAGGRGLWSV